MFEQLFPENTTFTSEELFDDSDVFVEFKNNKWTFTAPLPGVKSNEIKVSFKNNVISVTTGRYYSFLMEDIFHCKWKIWQIRRW